MYFRSCFRIEPRQQPVQIRRTAFGRACTQALAQFFGTLRAGKESFQQRSQVKTCPADYDGQAAAAGNLADHGPRLPRVFAGGERLVRLCDVEQMMRN